MQRGRTIMQGAGLTMTLLVQQPSITLEVDAITTPLVIIVGRALVFPTLWASCDKDHRRSSGASGNQRNYTIPSSDRRQAPYSRPGGVSRQTSDSPCKIMFLFHPNAVNLTHVCCLSKIRTTRRVQRLPGVTLRVQRPPSSVS